MAFTIRDLIAGREQPVSIVPDASARAALDLMFTNEFTQLPVIDAERHPIGLITGDSILRAVDSFKVSIDGLTVRNAMESVRKFDPEDGVFELLNGLNDRYAVLVVDADDKLIGILTGYDTAEYFRDRAEDLMLIEDIETGLRDRILAVFERPDGGRDDAMLALTIADVVQSGDKQRKKFQSALAAYLAYAEGGPGSVNDEAASKAYAAKFADGKAKNFDDLTLQQYINLLFHETCWPKASVEFFGTGQDALRNLLEGVREVRNALAHFREVTPRGRAALQVCARTFGQAAPLQAPERHKTAGSAAAATLLPRIENPAAFDDVVAPNESKYAKLALWLQRTSEEATTVDLSFEQLEGILGDRLPRSAREHRSWWANDTVSHPQSREWIEVGWRVSGVALSTETVRFERLRDRKRAYIEFFSKTIPLVKAIAPFRVKEHAPQGLGWHSFATLPGSGGQEAMLVESFARGHRLRVELYIDTGIQSATKTLFDRLYSHRAEVEAVFGEALSWERMDAKRASRIAAYRPGSITADAKTIEGLEKWGASALVRLHAALAPYF